MLLCINCDINIDGVEGQQILEFLNTVRRNTLQFTVIFVWICVQCTYSHYSVRGNKLLNIWLWIVLLIHYRNQLHNLFWFMPLIPKVSTLNVSNYLLIKVLILCHYIEADRCILYQDELFTLSWVFLPSEINYYSKMLLFLQVLSCNCA